MTHLYSDNLSIGEYFQIRDNWQGPGYRLYIGNDRYVVQVGGELNGRVYKTIKEAQDDCLRRFFTVAKRVRD